MLPLECRYVQLCMCYNQNRWIKIACLSLGHLQVSEGILTLSREQISYLIIYYEILACMPSILSLTTYALCPIQFHANEDPFLTEG